MKYIKILLIAALMAGGAGRLCAVSDSEMEKARVTAAKIYLRWSNNGSDYLDKLDPVSLPELEKSLKDTEKKNLAAFKAVKLPKDYASWDKAALVKYWSATFFESAGLNADGVRQGARTQVRRRIESMTVSDPVAVRAENQSVAKQEDPAAADTVSASVPASVDSEAARQEAEMASRTAAVDSITAALAAVDDMQEEKSSASGSTWLYVVVLVLLVAAVIWLVVFASKTLKRSEGATAGSDSGRMSDSTAAEPARQTDMPSEAAETRVASVADETARMREKFANSLAVKTEEIRTLNRRLQEVMAESDSLSAETVALREENARLRRELESLRASGMAESGSRQPAMPEDRPSTARPPQAPQPAAEPRGGRQQPMPQQPREIFLGRVNNRGIFVRADRLLNPGMTVYSLLTSDGYSGTYRVVSDPDSVQTALDNPEEWLANGCVAKDLTDTTGKTAIMTEAAGTAVFENGTWRVIRKARVKYV